MEPNTGPFPEERPVTGRKVLRKVIAQRLYRYTGDARINVANRDTNQRSVFNQPDHLGRTAFMNYVLGENFFVYISALFYLKAPPMAPTHEVTDRDIAWAWAHRPDNVRQWGVVVFTSKHRGVSTMWHFGHQIWGPLAPICQLYPCLSYDTDLQTQQRSPIRHICVGLFYGQTTATGETGVGDARGRRRYVRGPIPDPTLAGINNKQDYANAANQMLHQLGNVWEIIDQRFLAGIPTDIPNLVARYFVLYVCAGARLVVFDDLNYNDGHNRTLVQQGGFVAMEYELEWAPPRPVLHPQGPFRPVTTAQAIAGGFLRPNDATLSAGLQEINCPVVFLGATESQYETHCWALNIGEHEGRRRALLSAPEGGIVTAIENYANGVPEIVARHRYEQLYASVVTNENYRIHYCCQQFGVPGDQVLLNRILGSHPYYNRWLSVNYNAPCIYQTNVAPVTARPAPSPYTPRVCVNHYVVGSQLRPPMPPLSPLFHIEPINNMGNSVGAAVHRFMPTEYNPEWRWRRNGTEWHRLVRGNKYEKYTRAAQPQEVDHYQTGKCHYYDTDHIDGRSKYVGIDGWVYNKQNANKVGTFQYPVYQRPDATHNLYND